MSINLNLKNEESTNKTINNSKSIDNIMTIDSVREMLPNTMRASVTQNIVDLLNTAANKPEDLEFIRDNFITYSDVIYEGKFKLESYLNAIKFTSFKLLGKNNREAYSLTFPEKYREMIADGKPASEISAYISAYSKTKLVTLLHEQMIVPDWILYRDIYNKAVKKNYDLMFDEDVSPTVQQKAAECLMRELKRPEEASKVDIKIDNSTKVSFVGQLEEAMNLLAQKQVESGKSASELISNNIIEGEYEEQH